MKFWNVIKKAIAFTLVGSFAVRALGFIGWALWGCIARLAHSDYHVVLGACGIIVATWIGFVLFIHLMTWAMTEVENFFSSRRKQSKIEPDDYL
jgi:hypothetical protein